MIRLTCLLLIICTLNGCVGFAVGTLGTVETQYNSLKLNSYYEGKKRFAQGGGESPYTKAEIISIVGEPDGTYAEGNCEVLSYGDGFSWSAAGAFIFVFPIGLVVPTGYEENKIYLINGKSYGFVSERIGLTSKLGPFCFLFTHGGNCDFSTTYKDVDVSFCQKKND